MTNSFTPLPACPACDSETSLGRRAVSEQRDGEVPIDCPQCGEVGVFEHSHLRHQMYTKDAINLANGS